MADILKYRIPDQSSVEFNGFFKEVEENQISKGFVLSTFLKDQYYQFKEVENSKGDFHFSIEKPYVASKNEYINEASSFLNSFEKYDIQKAVFSRIKAIEINEKKIDQYFNNLCEKYPKAFVYLISSKLFGTWLGATPEILISTVSNTGFTISLAGTLPTTNSNGWTNKEFEEQRLVTEYIDEQLQNLAISNIEKNGPYDYEAGPVKHLRTDFSFDIENEKSFTIAKKLHPTPAVSGLPQKFSVNLINFREPHERQFYTGIIGVIGDKKTNLYVNLRCCQIQKGFAYLYLGGGFTPDSDVEKEWEETENKAKTLTDILK